MGYKQESDTDVIVLRALKDFPQGRGGMHSKKGEYRCVALNNEHKRSVGEDMRNKRDLILFSQKVPSDYYEVVYDGTYSVMPEKYKVMFPKGSKFGLNDLFMLGVLVSIIPLLYSGLNIGAILIDIIINKSSIGQHIDSIYHYGAIGGITIIAIFIGITLTIAKKDKSHDDKLLLSSLESAVSNFKKRFIGK